MGIIWAKYDDVEILSIAVPLPVSLIQTPVQHLVGCVK